jgi:hypothetical protein
MSELIGQLLALFLLTLTSPLTIPLLLKLELEFVLPCDETIDRTGNVSCAWRDMSAGKIAPRRPGQVGLQVIFNRKN